MAKGMNGFRAAVWNGGGYTRAVHIEASAGTALFRQINSMIEGFAIDIFQTSLKTLLNYIYRVPKS